MENEQKKSNVVKKFKTIEEHLSFPKPLTVWKSDHYQHDQGHCCHFPKA